MDILVRSECEKDYHRVEEITKLAFSFDDRIKRGGIGCPYEHWMINELRKHDGVMELSLVAEVEGVILGHIICSNAVIKLNERVLSVLNFGPVSVLPEYQKRGIGKALINAMITKSKELGYGAILFFGRPEYYPQFGFVKASEYGISDCEGNNFPAFMCMELIENYLTEFKGGRYFESDIYNDELNRDKVKQFDNDFHSIN